MGTPRYLTRTRLAEILRRQDPPKFGPTYEPSMKATREEAPVNSRPAFVWSELLRRDVSTFSEPERAVLAIILYCCIWLMELHEQRMLPILPSPHPLHGHPLAAGLDLPHSRGTLMVASEMGHMRFHPVVNTKSENDDEDGPAPGCLIGDYLLFLKDRAGPFCVNINVKKTRSEFEVPQVGVTVKTDMAKASAKQRARTEVERRVYLDIGIPTVEVAGDELPGILVANLQQLLLWQKRKHRLTSDQVQLVMDAFLDGLERQASALEVFSAVELSSTIRQYDQKIVLYQAIFARRIRVDLFECHFFVDKPMRPETQDPAEVFAHWFRRAV